MFDAAQAKVKLIARIFAETGIRDLFSLLHAVVRKHGSQAQTVRLRNQWVSVDPRDWKARNDMSINVGLGTGGKTEQLGHLMSLIGLQKEALAAGKTNLVSDDNLYNAAKEFTKLVGLKNVDRYFTDPKTLPAPQPGPDPLMLQLQMKNAIETSQAQADIATQQKKIEAEMALAQQKFNLEKELRLLDAQLKVEEHRRNTIADAVKASTAGEEQQGIDGRLAAPSAPAGAEGGDGQPTPASAAASGGGNGAGSSAALIAALLDTLNRMSAPKRARKLPDGVMGDGAH